MMRACAVVLYAGVVGALIGMLVFGCSLQPQGSVPGCRADHPSDCEQGWHCRSGVCVLMPSGGMGPDGAVEWDAADVFEDGAEKAAVDSGLDAMPDVGSDIGLDAVLDVGVETNGDVVEDVDDDTLGAGSGDVSEDVNEEVRSGKRV